MAAPESGGGRHRSDRRGPLERDRHPSPGPQRISAGVAQGRNGCGGAGPEPRRRDWLAASAGGPSRERRPLPRVREGLEHAAASAATAVRRPAAAPQTPAPRAARTDQRRRTGLRAGPRQLSWPRETGRAARPSRRRARGASRNAAPCRAPGAGSVRHQPRSATGRTGPAPAIVTVRPRPVPGARGRGVLPRALERDRATSARRPSNEEDCPECGASSAGQSYLVADRIPDAQIRPQAAQSVDRSAEILKTICGKLASVAEN